MQTEFEFSEKNDMVRFTCGAIKGGIYIHTDPILISINGPYPLEDVSEEALENCAHIVRDDFLTFTGFKNKAFNVIAKRLESSGQCFVYSFLFDPQGECHRDKQPIEAVLDQIAPEQVLGGEMCKGFLVKLDENRLWAFEPIHHFFACAIVDAQQHTVNLRVFMAEPIVIDRAAQEPIANKLLTEVIPALAEKYPVLKIDPLAKNSDPQDLYRELVDMIRGVELKEVPLSERTITPTGMEPITMRLGVLFGFRAMQGDQAAEHITVFTDGSGFWIETQYPVQDAEPIVTFEPKTREELMELAHDLIEQSEAKQQARHLAPDTKKLN